MTLILNSIYFVSGIFYFYKLKNSIIDAYLENELKLLKMKKIVVLSGAGISAESGINTFRDSDGLWEGHDVMQVASIEGWLANKELVLDFYNQRRRQLTTVKPNLAHEYIAALEASYEVQIITQNVDDLHERAGSTNIIHLHGELLKARGEFSDSESLHWDKDINLGDLNANNEQMRPDIVWFGEQIPKLDEAIKHCFEADFLIIIGTSLQVYPAAGLMEYTKKSTPIIYIDKNPALDSVDAKRVHVMKMSASEGMAIMKNKLLANT